MENQRDSGVPRLKSPGGVLSPINVHNFRFHHSAVSPIVEPYESDGSDSPSALMKYLCSAAPALAATVLFSPVFTTTLNVEEDVLVMDGVPVPKPKKGGRARVSSTLTSLNLNYTSSQPGVGVGAENSNSNKADVWRHWDDSGIYRFGSKCQFAHGRKELRPPFTGKKTLEIFKPYNNSSGSSCSLNKIIAASTSAAHILPLPLTPMAASKKIFEIQPKSASINDSKYPTSTLLSSNWSPLDDGIEVFLPLGSSERKRNPWKDLEAEIQKTLYDTVSTKRLPVFLNICTD